MRIISWFEIIENIENNHFALRLFIRMKTRL